MDNNFEELLMEVINAKVSSTKEFIEYAEANGIDLEDPFVAGFVEFSTCIDKMIKNGYSEEEAIRILTKEEA